MTTARESSHGSRLSQGYEALAQGDWSAARTAFDALVAESATAQALEGQSWAAWWQDDADTVFSTRERAYQLFRESGDLASAARMAIWLGNDYIDFRGEMAVSNGWLQVANRILDDLPTVAEHGWLAVLQADLALMLEEDTLTARSHAQRALAISRQVGDKDLEAMARTTEGLSLVTEGDLSRGMSLLDEAAAVAVSGGLADLASVSFVLCHLLYACERARDFERATQWCQRTREYADRIGFRFAQGTCRVHYAGVLLWRGMWAEAERELADASRYLSLSRPPWESEARVRVAELRRLQGRTPEALALFREVDWHPLAPMGMAEIALDAGQVQDALEYVERVLRTVPPRNLAQRAAAVDLQVRVLVAAGDAAGAAAALDEFERIATVVGTQPLRAAALQLKGEVALAEDDETAARACFEDAIAAYDRCGAPYEASRSRLSLAALLHRNGRSERARTVAGTARTVFERLGAMSDAERAGRLAGLRADERPAEAGVLTARQIEVLRLVAQGMSDREIASALVMSEHTVHRHIANILQRLDEPTRAAAVAHSSRLGLL